MPSAPKSGLGKALVGVSILMLVLSWLAVITRIWVRRWVKALGADDLMMVVGLILFTVVTHNTLSFAYNGVGTLDIDLDARIAREGRKWFFISVVSYCLASLAIKCSICMALLRLTRSRRYRIPLYAIMVLCFIASISTSLVNLLWCRPLVANWDYDVGNCNNLSIPFGMSYYFSTNSIVTDWACAIIPAFMLWDIQLRMRIKVSIVVMLALGALASIATCVRLAYFKAYGLTENFMYNIAKIGIWSMVELGLGVVAGSMAMFRPLFRLIPFLSESSSGERSSTTDGPSFQLMPISCIPNGSKPDVEDQRLWERSDAESQKHILKETEIVLSNTPESRAL